MAKNTKLTSGIPETPEITEDAPESLGIPEVEAIDADIVKYPGFMHRLYTLKLASSENLTPSPGLENEREIWSVKRDQAAEILNKQKQ